MAPAESDDLALFARFPSLSDRLPRAPLCRLPTPVQRLEKLGEVAASGRLWIKRDDATSDVYGGNKPRKLEWILGDARLRGIRRVITTGGLGSNHGLACALYCSRLGIACDLVLVHQPVDSHVRRTLRLHRAAGARQIYARNVVGAGLAVAALWLQHPRTSLYVSTGGSNAVGAVGFVNAGLELAAQITAGELPEPARIYIALGSGGSVAGLAAGLALAGVGSRVVAVLVTDILPPGRRRLARMARAALRRLARAGAEIEPDEVALEIEIEKGFVGGGYGHRTPASEQAVRIALEREGVALETTYTGKTLAALLEREGGRDEPVLFWNTYAGDALDLEPADVQSLPRSLQPLAREAA